MGPRSQFVEKLKSMFYVCAGGVGVFSAFNIYQENEKYYENFILPLAHRVDPETSHKFAIALSKYQLIPKSKFQDPDTLSTKVWHLTFKNPVGVAAGFDKQGEAVAGLEKVGFGFVEIGSVTPEPQSGNEKPRVFRLPENSAIINRYGFNSEGHEIVHNRLHDLRTNKHFKGIIGVNLGKNKNSEDPVNDYVKGIVKFGDVADYLVINISSPNTPGLRDWQAKDQLRNLLNTVNDTRNKLNQVPPPLLLLKLAPDLTKEELIDISEVVCDPKCEVDGLVISNTTIGRDSNLVGPYAQESGGLSGLPLTDRSTEMISTMFRLTKGRIPIIGVGGIFSGKDAYDKIKAGASLVQFYTAFVYHGPPRVTRIKKELLELLEQDGYKSVAEAVGKDVKT